MVEEIAVSAAADQTGPGSETTVDALTRLDLGALVGGAARLRPERIAIHNTNDPEKSVTFGRLEQRTVATAQAWRRLGLAAGERILIITTASASCLTAMLGALHAGLDVALAAPHLNADDLADYAARIGASAIAGEPLCGDVDIGEAMFAAAAKAERVRMVAALGGTAFDGAAPLDLLAQEIAPADGAGSGARHALVITRSIDGQTHIHRQHTIVASALDFVTRVQIGTQIPMVSAILPASFAGLACGPAAALIAGAPLVLHAPFDAEKFVAICEALHPVHLVAPVMMSEEIAASGLVHGDRLASLVLLARYKHMPGEIPAEPPGGLIETDTPVFDLYGIGEIAAFAERRLPSGARVAPLATQHMLNLDGRDVVAGRRKLHYLAADGRLDTVVAIEGAAVSI